jgi:glutamate racemase
VSDDRRPFPPPLRIGVFDSGVGGLSVLAALHARMPGSRFHYVADSAHAPYGERSDGEIAQRALLLARHLAAHGAQAIVVACNSATAVAVAELRRMPGALPVIGVEPGLKPALAATRNGRVGVMATAATLRSARFQALQAAHARGAQVHLQACDGLARAIEEAHDDPRGGDGSSPRLRETVERHCAPLRAAGVDTAVLGCTHYPFARAEIQRALGPSVTLIDTADAVARRAAEVCGAPAADPATAANGPIALLQSTGDAEPLRRFARRWLALRCEVEALAHPL